MSVALEEARACYSRGIKALEEKRTTESQKELIHAMKFMDLFDSFQKQLGLFTKMRKSDTPDVENLKDHLKIMTGMQ